MKKVCTPSRRIIQRWSSRSSVRTLSAFGQLPAERRLARLSWMWNHRGTSSTPPTCLLFFLRSLRHVCHGPSNVQSPRTFLEAFSSVSPLLEFSFPPVVASSWQYSFAFLAVVKGFSSKKVRWFVVKSSGAWDKRIKVQWPSESRRIFAVADGIFYRWNVSFLSER